MTGRVLNHTELVTIAEKDESYYRTHLEEQVQEVAQYYLGTRKWIQFRNVITFLSRFGYFATTTLSDVTTPGEEFCDAQLPKSNLVQNLLMTLLNNELNLPSEIPPFYLKCAKDIHLITFFLFGDFYELAKRVTNHVYRAREMTNQPQGRVRKLYQALGCLSFVRLLLDVLNHSSSKEAVDREETSSSKQMSVTDELVDPNMVCHLCCEERQDPTCALCGHIFCWTCIHQWLKNRSECPICRAPTEPSRLVHLVNFR